MKHENGNLGLAVLLSFLAAVLLTGLITLKSFWGINHLHYYPFYAAIIFGLLGLSVIFLPRSDKLSHIIEKTAASYAGIKPSIRVVITSIVALVLFYLLRTRVYTLGDGYLRVYQISQDLMYNYTEPLDFYLHAVSFKIFSVTANITAESIYIWYSIICGTLFAAFLCRFDFEDEDILDSVWLKLMIFSFGGIQLFFGYVESYSLIYPASILFVLYGYRFYHTNKGALTLSMLMIVALSSHLMGAILLPAYFFLIIRDFAKRGFRNNLVRIIGPSLLILTVVILALFDYRDWKLTSELRTPFFDRFLPLAGNYGIFSFSHFIDVVNELLLVLPGTIVLLPFLAGIKNNKRSKIGLFAILVVPAGLFVLIIDPQLGFARDWDLFAVPVAIIGTATLMQYLYNGRFRSLSQRAKITAVCFGIIMTGLWILTNASESRQLDRAEDILMQTNKSQGYGLELLAHHYSEKRHDPKTALRILNEITGDARNARVMYKIARLEFKSEHYRKALSAALEGYSLDSTDAKLMVLAGTSYLLLNRPEEALPFLKPASEIKPTEAVIFRYLGLAYHRLDSLDKSAYAYERSIILDPTNASSFYNVARVYLDQGKLDSAMVKVNRCLEVNPRFPGAQELYREILVRINDDGSP